MSGACWGAKRSVGAADEDERRPEEGMGQRDLGPGEIQARLQDNDLCRTQGKIPPSLRFTIRHGGLYILLFLFPLFSDPET